MADADTTLRPRDTTADTPPPNVVPYTPPDTMDQSVRDYITYKLRAGGGVLHFRSDIAHMPHALKDGWFPEEPKWQPAVAKLQKRIQEYAEQLSHHVHPGAQLQLDIHLTNEPSPIAPSPHAIESRAAFDTASGLIHHRVGPAEEIENHPAASTVSMGLMMACRSIEKGGDGWQMDYNQGGNQYQREAKEMNEDSQWRADRKKWNDGGVGHAPFIGPGWAPKPLEGQKAMGIGALEAGELIDDNREIFAQERANGANMGRVRLGLPGGARSVGALAAAAGGAAAIAGAPEGAVINPQQRANEEFFVKQREEDRRRQDREYQNRTREGETEFFKKQNEEGRRLQEQNTTQAEAQRAAAEKSNLETERILASREVEASLARVREAGRDIRQHPELLEALRIAQSRLAAIPGASPQSQIDIQTSNLELSDAAEDALRERNRVTAEAQGTAVRMSAEAAEVATKNLAEGVAAQSAATFVAISAQANSAEIARLNTRIIEQGSADYTGHVEPVGGPEAPEGGQTREMGGASIPEGSEDIQGRDQPVAGAGIRSAEEAIPAGNVDVEGHVMPVYGEQTLREEESDQVTEGGVAEAGLPPSVEAQPQRAETRNEAAEEASDTRIAKQAQAIVEQEQRRGEVPAPLPNANATAGRVTGAAEPAQGETVSRPEERNEEQVGGVAIASGRRDAAALPEPEQPTQLQTEPASAPVERVLERADAVSRVVGEPPEPQEVGEPLTQQRVVSEAQQSAGREGSRPGEGQTPATAAAGVTAGQPPAEVIPQEAVMPERPGTEQVVAQQTGTGRDAASLAEPQQPTQLVTEPASAPAERVLERADAVGKVIGEPPKSQQAETPLAQPGSQQQREASVAQEPVTSREDRRPGETPPAAVASATAGHVTAGQEPSATARALPANAAEPQPQVLPPEAARPERPGPEPDTAFVQQRTGRDAASLPEPEQETGLVTERASEPVERTMHKAEVVSHLIPDAALASSAGATGATAAPAAVPPVPQSAEQTVAAASPPPVTPEREITAPAVEGAAATHAATQTPPPQGVEQAPKEVVTISPQTGEVVSEPADQKTFADIAAEAPPPTHGHTPENLDNTSQAAIDQQRQEHEAVGDLGLGSHPARDRMKEQLASAIASTPPVQNAAITQIAPPARDFSQQGTATQPLQAAAISRASSRATTQATTVATAIPNKPPSPKAVAQTAPPARDLSKQATPQSPQGINTNKIASSTALQNRQATPATARSRRAPPASNRSVAAQKNAGLNGKAELGKRPIPSEADHAAQKLYAPLQKATAPKKAATPPAAKTKQPLQQKPAAKIQTVATSTPPKSFAAIKPAPRRATKLSAVPAKVKRPVKQAAPLRKAQRATPAQATIQKALPKSAAAQPRRVRTPAPRDTAKRNPPVKAQTRQRQQLAVSKPQTQHHRQQAATQRRLRSSAADIEPEPK